MPRYPNPVTPIHIEQARTLLASGASKNQIRRALRVGWPFLERILIAAQNPDQENT